MIAKPRPLTEITTDALQMLYQELGIVETVRFLSQFTTGFGNYTEERNALIADISLKEALAEIQAYQTTKES